MSRYLFLLATLCPLLALAGETLVIGVENQSYQPVYAYEQGEYQGYARELFDAWARDRGLKLEYLALPVPRLYASFFEGQVDFKFPDNPHWKQELRTGRALSYSDSVAAFVDGTSVLPANKGHGIDHVKVLGTMGGYTPWAWIDRIKAGRRCPRTTTSTR
jgi:ABC-type amino acid transport substrate-binding protein